MREIMAEGNIVSEEVTASGAEIKTPGQVKEATENKLIINADTQGGGGSHGSRFETVRGILERATASQDPQQIEAAQNILTDFVETEGQNTDLYQDVERNLGRLRVGILEDLSRGAQVVDIRESLVRESRRNYEDSYWEMARMTGTISQNPPESFHGMGNWLWQRGVANLAQDLTRQLEATGAPGRSESRNIRERITPEIAELIKQAEEAGILEDVKKALDEVFNLVRNNYQQDPGFARRIINAARGSHNVEMRAGSRAVEVKTAAELERVYWEGIEGVADVSGWGDMRFKGIRAIYYELGLLRIEQEGVRVRDGVRGGLIIPAEHLRPVEKEWDLAAAKRKEARLWDIHETFHTLYFHTELIHSRADLETAFRQFIRQFINEKTTPDDILKQMDPLGTVVHSVAIEIGLTAKQAARLRAEATGRLLVHATDYFAGIGRGDAVVQLMDRFTDNTGEMLLGMMKAYEGDPLRAGQLLTMNGPEGRLGIQPRDRLYRRFQELGIYHPENITFRDYYHIEGPQGELYNDKVKQEKYRDLIKMALANILMRTRIKGINEDSRNENVDSITSDTDEYGRFLDRSDREFLEMFENRGDFDQINQVIEDAMEAFYQLDRLDELRRRGVPLTPQQEVDKKKWEAQKDLYKELSEKAEDAVATAMELFTSFAFSSELLCPRIWKRESVKYVEDEEGDYILDDEGVYVIAHDVVVTTTDKKTNHISIVWDNEATNTPKFIKAQGVGGKHYRRVQGDYVRDAEGHRMLVSVEDLVEERLRAKGFNTTPADNPFYGLDDRSRAVFVDPKYPKPQWVRDYLQLLDPEGFLVHEDILPEQRDLILRKNEQKWQAYIIEHRQLLIDYAQEGREVAGDNFPGRIPPNFFENYTAEHPGWLQAYETTHGVDTSTPAGRAAAQAALESEYKDYIYGAGGFGPETRAGDLSTKGIFLYQKDILYGGGNPFAMKKNLYLPYWIIGDPVQNMQKDALRSTYLVSFMDSMTRSAGRHLVGGTNLRRFTQALELMANDRSEIFDDYETKIWVRYFGGADRLRVLTQGQWSPDKPSESGFLHSFHKERELLKEGIPLVLIGGQTRQPNPYEQDKIVKILSEVFERELNFAAAYLTQNERSSVPGKAKWAGVRFMNAIFEVAGSRAGWEAYPELGPQLYYMLNCVRLSQYKNRTPREHILALLVKNYV